MTDLTPNRSRDGKYAEKIQAEASLTLGAPGNGNSTLSTALKERFEAARELHEANAQNNWVEAVRAKHPDAAYAYPVPRAGRGNTSIRRIALHDAVGEDIAISLQDNDKYMDAFDTSWDMGRHITPETNKIFVPGIGVFSMDSVEQRWNGLEDRAAASLDNGAFGHLSGMEKATAQADYAQSLNREAASAYVEDLSAKILTVNPDAARLYVNRKADVEYGLTFSLDRVEDKYGNFVDIDLTALEQDTFQDVHLDAHVDSDDSADQLYINLDPGH